MLLDAPLRGDAAFDRIILDSVTVSHRFWAKVNRYCPFPCHPARHSHLLLLIVTAQIVNTFSYFRGVLYRHIGINNIYLPILFWFALLLPQLCGTRCKNSLNQSSRPNVVGWGSCKRLRLVGRTWYGGLQFRTPEPLVLEASIPTLQHLYAILESNKI